MCLYQESNRDKAVVPTLSESLYRLRYRGCFLSVGIILLSQGRDSFDSSVISCSS